MVVVLLHFFMLFFPRWNRPDINNMKSREDKCWIEACSAQRYMYASKTKQQQKIKHRLGSHYSMTKTKNKLYMFSNIFVLYYIQLSLLKMNYRWLLYCRTEKKVNCIDCAVPPAGLWHDVQRLSLPRWEKTRGSVLCLRVLPWVALLPPLLWSKAFCSIHKKTDCRSPHTTQFLETKISSHKKGTFLYLFYY